MYRIILIVFLGSMISLSCGDEDRTCEADMSSAEIRSYLDDNNIDADSLSSGLYFSIEDAGSLPTPSANSNVTVHYHGYFMNGDVFDSSIDRGTPSTFNLNQVITGWQQGIPIFGKGGRGTLYIPCQLAYGNSEVPGIPVGSVLIFDIELIDFN